MDSHRRAIEIQTHADDRGFLREILRIPTGQGGQITWTKTYPGVIKAFHAHRRQDDYWCCVCGSVEAVLIDVSDMLDEVIALATSGCPMPLNPVADECRVRTRRYYLGEDSPLVLHIPAGYLHGYRVLGNAPATLIYYTTKTYDPDDPDEIRVPYDSKVLGVNWTTQHR